MPAATSGPEELLPLAPGSTGPAVEDLQRRLAAAGHCRDDLPWTDGVYDEATERAVRAVQAAHDIVETGTVDRHTWRAIVEAGYRLGDRPLYLHRPMLRGDDVADLQLRLGELGFDAGWVDGIFGPDSERALKDFQRNAGLPTDGIAGPTTITELARLGTMSARGEPVVRVRERERGRRHAELGLRGQRIVVGETGALGALADATGRVLRHAGADVLTLHGPDLSLQARDANHFGGDAYVGFVTRRDATCLVRYFSTAGFESWGGRQLAEDMQHRLHQLLGHDAHVSVAGSRTTVLRETRMPAIWCELGPVPAVVRQHHALAHAFADALAGWGADRDRDGDLDRP